MESKKEVEMKVTSIEDLKSYAKGKVVELSDFADGQPFIARLRRPSMLGLAKEGKIPNSLMASASKLFVQGANQKDVDSNTLKELSDILDLMCKEALIEPKLSDIESAGLSLTDKQKVEIFQYTQQGVKALESFRGK